MTKYGYSTIGFICIFVFVVVGFSFFLNNAILKYIFIAAAVLLLGFTLYFFRDPDRQPPGKDNIIVSPADGRVLLIKEVEETRYIKDTARQISIFMSPVDVHVNRIPVSGRIDYLNYIEGGYLIASDDKASERNERAEIGILSKKGKILFTQVAGFVARRIVYEIKPGDDVKIGERFGMIKFGSRVDIIAPLNWIPNVKPGDKTRAGETILFTYGNK